MKIDVLAGLPAAAQFALETPFLEDRSNRPGGEKRLLSDAIEVGDVSADQFLRRKAVSAYPLVTACDDSIKVSGEDRVLQLVQNAGLKNGFTRPRRDRSARSCGFL